MRGWKDWCDPWAAVCMGLTSSYAICTNKPETLAVGKKKISQNEANAEPKGKFITLKIYILEVWKG